MSSAKDEEKEYYEKEDEYERLDIDKHYKWYGIAWCCVLTGLFLFPIPFLVFMEPGS